MAEAHANARPGGLLEQRGHQVGLAARVALNNANPSRVARAHLRALAARARGLIWRRSMAGSVSRRSVWPGLERAGGGKVGGEMECVWLLLYVRQFWARANAARPRASAATLDTHPLLSEAPSAE